MRVNEGDSWSQGNGYNLRPYDPQGNYQSDNTSQQGGYRGYGPQQGGYSYQQNGGYSYQQGAYQERAYYRRSYNGPVSADDKTLAILAHLSAILAMLVSAGWLSFVGPLLVWLVKKDSSPFVRRAAAQSFNFNLAMTAMSIVGWICFITLIGIPVAILLWIIAFVMTLWHHIKAAMAANRGVLYRYPIQIPILH